MGFFGKLFKKQEEPEKIEQEKIEGLVDWLKKSNSDKINSILTELSSLWKELLDQTSSLQSSIFVLEKSKFEPNDKMYAPINMIKDRFVTKSKLLNKIPKSIPENFSGIKFAYSETSKVFSELKEADIKQAHVVSVYFKKEAEQIIKTLKNIDNTLSVFEEKLNSEGLVLEVVESGENKFNSIMRLKNDIQNLEKNKSGLEKEIEKKKESLEKQKVDLNNINRDQRWLGLERCKKELEKIDAEIQKVKHSVAEEISSVKRPIKKVLHDSSIKGELSESIENLDSVYSTVNSVNKILEKSNVGLKESELEKLRQFINKVKSGEFDELKKNYDKLYSEKEELSKKYEKIREVEKIKDIIEKKIKEAESGLLNLEVEKKNLESEEIKSNQEIQTLKTEIEKLVLEKLGTELKIV